MAPYILAWFYSAFLTTAAVGAHGSHLELARALYIFSGIVFVLGIGACYILYRKNIIFSKKEYKSVFILYFLGFGVANFFAGFI